jgi:general secretion pathway protein D
MSNHISGEGYSTNDQFMRVNAFLGSADLSMILHMLSQRSDTDLLSAPKVLTKPGEEAVMKVVTEYIYPTDYDVQIQSSSSSSGNNSGGGQSAILAIVEPQSFTMREVGVILQVTPELTEEGNLINLQLNTQVVDEPTWKNYGMRIPFTGNSSLQNFDGLGDIFSGLSDIFDTLGSAIPDATKALMAEQATDSAMSALENLSDMDSMTYYDAPMEQPFFHVRSIESNVAVTPGATIVMGGLITEARKAMDDKVPFLGDLPFIGRFFRSHAEHTSKRNLLIFVTSRLVDTRGREITLSSGDETVAVTQPAPEKEAE